MLNTKRMRFPIDIILVCIRWYAAYPLSYRHLEEMMEERGVFVDHSSINRWAIRFYHYLKKLSTSTNAQLVRAGEWTRRTLR
jgi:putative transposase